MDYIHGQRIKNKQNALLLGKVMKLAKMISQKQRMEREN